MVNNRSYYNAIILQDLVNNNNQKDTNSVPMNFSQGDRPESDVIQIQVEYYII